MFILILMLFVLVGGALTVLTVLNLVNQVHLSLFGLALDVPAGLLLLVAFVLGALFLYIVAVLSALYDYREIRRLRTRVAELERQAAVAVPMTGTGPLASSPPMMPIPMPGMPNPPQS